MIILFIVCSHYFPWYLLWTTWKKHFLKTFRSVWPGLWFRL